MNAAPDTEALARAAAAGSGLYVDAIAAGAPALEVARTATALADAITVRLIELAQVRLGPAPVAWVWLASGSQGRRELTPHSDQDNSLILADDWREAEHGAYFAALAGEVNDGLHACGYRRCPGEVMASNPLWRQPWAAWRDYFEDWVGRTDSRKAMLAANFFDMRPVAGDHGLHRRLFAAVLPTCAAHESFLIHMVSNAVSNRPALGLFRTFAAAGNGKVDVKINGLIPIVDIARIHALALGRPEVDTLARLQAAAGRGRLSGAGAAALQDAFAFISGLRARHQAAQLRAGSIPNNFLDPAQLSPQERRRLKDAFAATAVVQRALAQAFAAAGPAF